jgi:hypothetical protein
LIGPSTLDVRVALHFADVVNQAEQLPLRRHLAPAAVTEPVQPMRAANVRKHRLHDPQPLTVTVAASSLSILRFIRAQ